MTTVTATSRAAPAGAPVQRVHYLLSRQAIDALPREQQNAFSYLVGLAQRGDFAAIAETKRWAGVGNPAGVPAGHEAIGPETLQKVALAFARAGHPLSTEHVNAFKANRDLSGGSALGPTTAKALYDQVVSSAAPPPEDYRRVDFRGATVSVRTRALLERAEALSARLGGPSRFSLSQGSYHPGYSKSGHTHDRGGAVDVRVDGKSREQQLSMVKALRSAGFAAWLRGPADGMAPHIHAVALGDRELSPAARHQVDEYGDGGDGLRGSRPDAHGTSRRDVPAWARRFL